MPIRVSPFIDPDRDDRYDPRLPSISFNDLKEAFRHHHGNEIGILPAADGILAEFARRLATNAPSMSDEFGQAKMWDVREVSRALEFEFDDETFEDIATILGDYLSFDAPPIDVEEPYAYAYLDAGGYERGTALLARYFGWDRYAPAADRVVSINHNSVEFCEIRRQLDDISDLVRTSNSTRIASVDERERIRVQIESGKRLLSIQNVSLLAVSGTLISALKYLAAAFQDEAIGMLASSLLDAILKALGLS